MIQIYGILLKVVLLPQTAAMFLLVLFGKSSEIASNRRREQELTMLALHLLQNSLVYINTLMLQQVLAQDNWQNRLTEEDWRGLTPLFYLHINPYGDFSLDMTTRLGIEDSVTV
jgi:hypothetical protein